MSIFGHKTPNLPEGSFIISPSLISKFFDYPKVWYEESYLGKGTFLGNNSTLLGTICHYIYEKVSTYGLGAEINYNLIENELIDYCIENNLENEVDYNEIIANYKAIAPRVVNDYVIPRLDQGVVSEMSLNYKLDDEDNIYLAGTCDRIETKQNLVVDFKTVSKKPNEMVIPFNYKIQLLAYAYLCKKFSIMNPTRIRIVYGVKPQKTIPARCIVVEELITDDCWKLIEDTLQLIVDTIKYIRRNPDSVYIIFKSMELKNG